MLINTNSIEKQFFTFDREHANKEINQRLVPHFGQATVHCTDGSTLVGECVPNLLTHRRFVALLTESRKTTAYTPWTCPFSMFVADTGSQIRYANAR